MGNDGLGRLDGRVAVVTGGLGGIGGEIAAALGERGARVVVTHREDADSDEVAQRVAAITPAPVLTVGIDLQSVATIAPAVDQITRDAGPIAVLVNNAGTNVQQDALDVDEATWDEIQDVNVKGLFFLSQAVARTMVAAAEPPDGGYSIVNVASQMGLVGFYRRAAYCASKAAVVNLTRVLAIEWAAHHIRVNAVAPTFIRTPLSEPMLADESFAQLVAERSPMGVVGEPRDVAEGVVFLSTPAARLITGHTLAIDGGWTAW